MLSEADLPSEGSMYQPWFCPVARVLYDYTPAANDEVEISQGQTLKILLNQKDAEWTLGLVIETGKQGLLPSSAWRRVRSLIAI